MLDESNILISVIVPVYSVEKYLDRCLISLCYQNFDRVEFLLVDDGSLDRSGEICEEYAKRDSRFRVFHKANGGLSSARNYGIDRARGDYLMFVDSDDWVRSDFCLTAYKTAIEYKSDLVMFRHQVVNEDCETCSPVAKLKSGYKSWQEGIDLMFGHVGVYAWNKLYKRSLFSDIRYPEGRVYEDQATTWQLVCKAEKIYFINQSLYYYFMRASSIVHQENLKNLKDRFDMRIQFYQGIESKGYSKDKTLSEMTKIALTYAIKVKMNPLDSTYVRASEILNSYKTLPGFLSMKQKALLFLYMKNTYLFDLCCEINGWKLSGQVV